jgi:hypothetical protein
MQSQTVWSTPCINWGQIIVAVNGALLTFTGTALLFAPEWFYQTIGTFPPFNRHYTGDLGAFQLPLGVALLLAAKHPTQHRLLLWSVAGGNLLHAFNHAYDALVDRASVGHWLIDVAPLLIMTLLLMAAIREPEQRSRSATPHMDGEQARKQGERSIDSSTGSPTTWMRHGTWSHPCWKAIRLRQVRILISGRVPAPSFIRAL